MDSLQSREKAQEDFFAHKQELELKIKAKAYRYFALWASEQLGITDKKEIEDYCQSIILYELDQFKGYKALDKVLKDLTIAGKSFSKFDLEDKLGEFIYRTRQEIIGNE